MGLLEKWRVRLLFWVDAIRRPFLKTNGWPYMAMATAMIIISVLWAKYYPGIISLYFRDQGYNTLADGSVGAAGVHYNALVPYRDYPLEYPFLSGAMMFAFNLMGYAFREPFVSLEAVLLGSSLMMGMAAAVIIVTWSRARVPAYSALLLFAISPVVLDQFDINMDMVAAALLLCSVYWLARGKETSSAVALALSAGVKGFPLIALPLMAWNAKKGRWRYVATSGGVFAAGMAVQWALSPTNFLRAGSYLTGYGIEGSWLGLVFPANVINYETFATWSSWIGTGSTLLHGLQPYEIASFCLLCLSLLLVWRNRARMPAKTAAFLLMSAIVLFWWYSPPQFLYYPMALLPLLVRRKGPGLLSSLMLVTGLELFGTETLWIRVPLNFNFQSSDWLYISIGYQVCLAVWLAYQLKKGTLLAPKVSARVAPA